MGRGYLRWLASVRSGVGRRHFGRLQNGSFVPEGDAGKVNARLPICAQSGHLMAKEAGPSFRLGIDQVVFAL